MYTLCPDVYLHSWDSITDECVRREVARGDRVVGPALREIAEQLNKNYKRFARAIPTRIINKPVSTRQDKNSE